MIYRHLRVLLLSLAIAYSAYGASIECKCKNLSPGDCRENGTCVSTGDYPSCHIKQRQDGVIEQSCGSGRIVPGFFCQGSGDFNNNGNESTIPYDFCCASANCNTEENLQAEIFKFNNPSTYIPTDTPLPTSTEASSAKLVPVSTKVFRTSSKLVVQTSSTLDPTSTPTVLSSLNDNYIIAVVAVLATVLILLCMFVGITVLVIIRLNPRHTVGIALEDGTPTISTESAEFTNDRLHELLEGTTTGSGSGLPMLEQRSVAAQVTLHELIGKGRYGEVWKANYKGDWIAVKLFHTREEASWFHEKHIYNTCLLRHPNVLRFIAADSRDVGIETQLWLITEYCELGSLYQVLVNNTLDEETMLKMCSTAASGLAHLHSEMTATEGKPPIAHRDLKSRNILVKSDYSCCIADLGLALRYDRATDTIDDLPTKRVGTRRYLPPEVLDESITTKNFDSFKRADMYSFGLVLWEITRRGECAGHVEEYQPPYFDCVGPDPSFDDMKRVVATEMRRPAQSNHWSQSEVFQGLTSILAQCWHHNPEARLTALRVKKNLNNLRSTKGKLKDDNII